MHTFFYQSVEYIGSIGRQEPNCNTLANLAFFIYGVISLLLVGRFSTPNIKSGPKSSEIRRLVALKITDISVGNLLICRHNYVCTLKIAVSRSILISLEYHVQDSIAVNNVESATGESSKLVICVHFIQMPSEKWWIYFFPTAKLWDDYQRRQCSLALGFTHSKKEDKSDLKNVEVKRKKGITSLYLLR